MTKLNRLQPFKEPQPPERESCVACKTFAPEVLVPDGDAALPMCWLCAHHVVDHGSSLQGAPSAECECTPQEIYPTRGPGHLTAFRVEHGDSGSYASRKNPHPDDWKTGHVFNPATREIETHYRGKKVSDS